MTKIDGRTTLKMEVALEEVFRSLPHGGDHESRKHVAKKLIQSAKKGNVTLDGLRAVGEQALQQLLARGQPHISSNDTSLRLRSSTFT
jgi:hypothetical protein